MPETSTRFDGERSGERFAPDREILTGEAGYLHSRYAGSVVDGPGVRTVLWTTGCVLQCRYCHNPDTWKMKNGQRVRAADVVNDLTRYARFMSTTAGGITISGGEPLVQAPFVIRIFKACKAHGIHTALDTSGFLGERLSDTDLESVDLVLLDLKAYDPALHLDLTGRPVAPVRRFAQRLAGLKKRVWIRHVLVPGWTDAPEHVDRLAGFAASLGNVERVEVLPFHQMGRAKWEQLGVPYSLTDVVPPSRRRIDRVVEQFRSVGLETF